MKQTILNKVLATMLIITLTFANILLLGVHASETYATSENLEKQSIQTNNENIEFDVYYKDANGNKIHEIKQDISTANLTMYAYVKVQKGYIKDATIKIYGESESEKANIKISNSDEPLELIENIDSKNNSVELKQIDKNTEIVLEIPVESSREELYDISNLSKVNTAKFTATYVNDSGKEKKIESKIKQRVEWEGIANPILTQEVSKYIPYDIENQKGVILETKIKSGLENNALPIQETNIEIDVPTILNIKPKKVVVTASSTEATNGKKEIYFGTDNWNYDEQNSKITINVKNEANNNIVSWKKDCTDEYILTYIYGEEVYAVANEEQTVNQKVSATIKAYNSTTTQVSKELQEEIKLHENIGEVVGQELKLSIQEMSKGNLYTKSERETEYKVTSITDVSNSDLVDSIVLINSADTFITENLKQYSALANYKLISISKENFTKMLGQDGEILILNSDKQELAKFNKEYKEDENGNYTYNFEGIDTNSISIVTTKPVTEGRLVLNYTKNLKGNTNYSKTEISNFEKLNIKVEKAGVIGNTVISKSEINTEIKLVEPSTKIEVKTNNEELSTIVENQNVEIRAILRKDTIDCDLYKNPIVKIVLPSFIDNIKINSINIAFDDELEIAKYDAKRNSKGEIEIIVKLEGEDTVYNSDTVSKGANIIINSDITLKNLTPTTESKIQLFVQNENVTRYENEVSNMAYAEAKLNAVAPIGLVTTNTITEYNKSNETVTSISGQEEVGKLDYKGEEQTATTKMNIINNYDTNIENISILGRVPFAGNKDILTNEDLGTTLDVEIANAISVNGLSSENVTIYYSDNENATKDLTDSNNNWQTSMNKRDVKSYLIVLNDYQMTTGEVVEVNYNINIPANLNYNTTVASNYAVYYTPVRATANEEVAVATKVSATTGQGTDLTAEFEANVTDGEVVTEGQIIKYTVKVKNTGTQLAENIKIVAPIPQNTVYIEQEQESGEMYDEYIENHEKVNYEYTIKSLEIGQEEVISYEVKVQSIPTNATQDVFVEANATISADDMDADITTSTIKNRIKEGVISANITIFPRTTSTPLREEEEFTITTKIKNVNTNLKNNVKVSMKLPEGLTYQSACIDGIKTQTAGISYDAQTRIITYTWNKIAGQELTTLEVRVKVDKITDNSIQKNYSVYSEITCDELEGTLKTNVLSLETLLPKLETTYSNNRTNGTFTDEEDIEYYVTVENKGKAIAENVTITELLPEELIFVEAKYTTSDGKTTQQKSEQITLNIPQGEKVQFTFKAKADKLKNVASKEIENKIIVKCEKISYEEIITTKHTIKAVKEEAILPDGTIEEKTYNISGTAWFDENKDGKRDGTEKVIPGIDVMMINADNGTTLKDATGTNLIVKTDENGTYIFENLKKGNYIVVFLYDSSMYDVTTYKATDVAENENSDAITMDLKIDNSIVKGAISDKLQLENANIYNIDIGLFENLKFDLKLDKAITKITVSNTKETKEYNYNYSKVAKVDLKAKEVEGTNIIIEYKITVTNEGAIPGYAKRIVDYIPSDMKFSSELNKDWYVGEDGNLYNSQLANTLLQPGENKEISLVLTKKMTQENTGVINNNAEIYESYNDYGKEDTDSIVANKSKNEDDLSYADAVIGIKTGEIYIYTLITLISISIFGLGIYFINKKVLRRIM